MVLLAGLFGDLGLVECIQGAILACMLHLGCGMLSVVIFTAFLLHASYSVHNLREESFSTAGLQR